MPEGAVVVPDPVLIKRLVVEAFDAEKIFAPPRMNSILPRAPFPVTVPDIY